MFKLYNRNPRNEKLPDCVCRAISLATDCDYDVVMRLLYENGIDYGCETLCVDCYSKMLNDIGYECKDAAGKTIKQIADENQSETILVRIDGHLTCCINGDCYDLWDCSGEKATCYWLIK